MTRARAALVLLPLGLLAGCGGGDAQEALRPVTLDPGLYAGTASVLPRGAGAALTFETRTFVTGAGAGAVRVFALGPTSGAAGTIRGRRATLVSPTRATPQPEGLVVAATLDGVGSTGEFALAAEPPFALNFQGGAFSLATTAASAALPVLGEGRTLASARLAGELYSLDANGDVDDWGDASGTLTLAPDGSALFMGSLNPVAGSGGAFAADLSGNGTAVASGFATGGWSSDGGRLVVRFERTGDALLLVLNRG